MRKINLGSGPVSARGWINYDWGLLPFLGKYRLIKIFTFLGILDKSYDLKWPKVELVDIRRKLPDDDNSVNFLYCSNVLEHFTKEECLIVLKECFRVLKKGGVLRVVVPDLKKLIKNYRDADEFNREFLGYDPNLYEGFLGQLKKYFIRGHQWMYDKNSMKKMLKDGGFSKIEIKKRKHGNLPNLSDLDLEVHEKLALYYEAEKN